MSISTQVLIVDDYDFIREQIHGYLTELGFTNITSVENGKEAFDRLMNPDLPQIGLVILDRQMPVMDGIELLKKIRDEIDLVSLPVIFCTSINDRAGILEAISAGATNYIVKPFTKDILTQKISTIPGIMVQG